MPVNNEALNYARETALSYHGRFNIGTYKERSRHLILKLYYEPCADNHEVKVGHYTADVLQGSTIIEVQTGSFVSLVNKINYYLDNNYSVKVVYPVNAVSRVCWCDTETGNLQEGKYISYPKAKYKLLPELKYVLPFFDNKDFSIEIVYCKTTNYKLRDGYGEGKKRRATKTDSVIDDIIDIEVINSTEDIASFVSLDKELTYTSKLFSKQFRLRGIKLWSSIKNLERANLVEQDTAAKSREKKYIVK